MVGLLLSISILAVVLILFISRISSSSEEIYGEHDENGRIFSTLKVNEDRTYIYNNKVYFDIDLQQQLRGVHVFAEFGSEKKYVGQISGMNIKENISIKSNTPIQEIDTNTKIENGHSGDRFYTEARNADTSVGYLISVNEIHKSIFTSGSQVNIIISCGDKYQYSKKIILYSEDEKSEELEICGGEIKIQADKINTSGENFFNGRVNISLNEGFEGKAVKPKNNIKLSFWDNTDCVEKYNNLILLRSNCFKDLIGAYISEVDI